MTSSPGHIFERIQALGGISEDDDRLTRTFCSRAMRRANDLVGGWMREAGMTVREDAIGNLIGRYEAQSTSGKTLLLGSHLDTVVNAGKFDGALGVLVAIECVARLHRNNRRVPFAIEVIGFCDEEGVRFQTTYLGGRAMAGTLDAADLKRQDRAGVTMVDALRGFGGHPDRLDSCRRDPKEILGYVEVHLEQGPVLESKNLPVGIVTTIAGQTRGRVHFVGQAGHAGTVPMDLRRDALCAAAEFVLAVEGHARKTDGLRATVGEISALPGASNVIPGEVSLTVDVRHADDGIRNGSVRDLRERAVSIAAERNCRVDFDVVQQAASVACDPTLSEKLAAAVREVQPAEPVFLLPSGAGHDAAALATMTPVAMLFVRCKGGISHHPEESVSAEDIGLATDVMSELIASL